MFWLTLKKYIATIIIDTPLAILYSASENDAAMRRFSVGDMIVV